ncbi:hypothetical protein BKA63DRAFT_599597 [Paraphoma chrysanthemicola]|nr:hypothetical protein BKA63DRAFT_599597 [Paraphoma chrysanthemicola]
MFPKWPACIDRKTPPLSNLIADHGRLYTLLASGNSYDLTIVCGNNTHKVHKAIVCIRCGFFERAERSPVGSEAASNNINHPEDEPVVIELLLQYLCTSEYQPELAPEGEAPLNDSCSPHTCARISIRVCMQKFCPHHICSIQCYNSCANFTCRNGTKDIDEAAELYLHSMMYAMADKYDVHGLKDLAAKKFERACRLFWSHEDHFAAKRSMFLNQLQTEMTGFESISSTLLILIGV